jgi:prefoldin subunit 5
VRFIDDVTKLLEATKISVALLIENLNTLLSKYRFMDMHLQSNKRGLIKKIPEIQRNVNMVKYLIKKKDDTDDSYSSFPLADGVYCEATIPPGGNTVCLWLGANVMLEYEYAEAAKLLATNLEQAEEKVRTHASDLMFLRDQITTTEVNIARVFNYDVVQRRKQKAAETETEAAPAAIKS